MFAIDNYDFSGKRAIIRVDFNVPLNGEGQVTDDTRIRAAIPTIKKVLEKGGAVILMSHLGRPKKNPDPKFSLEQIIPAIEARLGVKVQFAGDCMGDIKITAPPFSRTFLIVGIAARIRVSSVT